MADEPLDPSREQGFRRGLKFRRRDDYAVELFKEALAHLDDGDRVGRVLLGLSRFYNPYVNQPIVDSATRRRVLEALEAGEIEQARALIDERLKLYARFDDVEPS
jgi:predicted lactoylglutathione lyase